MENISFSKVSRHEILSLNINHENDLQNDTVIKSVGTLEVKTNH